MVIAPPSEFRISKGTVWVIKKPIYGLQSDTKPWYDELLKVCKSEGFDTDVRDEGILRLRNVSGTSVGILELHVDDASEGGTDASLQQRYEQSWGKVQIGSHEPANTEKVFYYFIKD